MSGTRCSPALLPGCLQLLPCRAALLTRIAHKQNENVQQEPLPTLSLLHSQVSGLLLQDEALAEPTYDAWLAQSTG